MNIRYGTKVQDEKGDLNRVNCVKDMGHTCIDPSPLLDKNAVLKTKGHANIDPPPPSVSILDLHFESNF